MKPQEFKENAALAARNLAKSSASKSANSEIKFTVGNDKVDIRPASKDSSKLTFTVQSTPAASPPYHSPPKSAAPSIQSQPSLYSNSKLLSQNEVIVIDDDYVPLAAKPRNSPPKRKESSSDMDLSDDSVVIIDSDSEKEEEAPKESIYESVAQYDEPMEEVLTEPEEPDLAVEEEEEEEASPSSYAEIQELLTLSENLIKEKQDLVADIQGHDVKIANLNKQIEQEREYKKRIEQKLEHVESQLRASQDRISSLRDADEEAAKQRADANAELEKKKREEREREAKKEAEIAESRRQKEELLRRKLELLNSPTNHSKTDTISRKDDGFSFSSNGPIIIQAPSASTTVTKEQETITSPRYGHLGVERVDDEQQKKADAAKQAADLRERLIKSKKATPKVEIETESSKNVEKKGIKLPSASASDSERTSSSSSEDGDVSPNESASSSEEGEIDDVPEKMVDNEMKSYEEESPEPELSARDHPHLYKPYTKRNDSKRENRKAPRPKSDYNAEAFFHSNASLVRPDMSQLAPMSTMPAMMSALGMPLDPQVIARAQALSSMLQMQQMQQMASAFALMQQQSSTAADPNQMNAPPSMTGPFPTMPTMPMGMPGFGGFNNSFMSPFAQPNGFPGNPPPPKTRKSRKHK